jgi:aminoglycoside N3'-acetyltransferase
MTFAEFREKLARLVGQDDRPLVVYSGLWQIGRSFDAPFVEVPQAILETLHDLAGSRRTLVMPTYTSGFRDGVFDLDSEPSQTGVLTELFRKSPGTLRTASAFFSFAARGPEAEKLAALRPRDAWGDGSVFEWMERENAHMIMVGESWDACSLKHRSEWLAQVPYRYLKEFKGTAIRGGKPEPLTERLFVRSLDPLVENIWHGIAPLFEAHGMGSFPIGGGHAAHMDAQELMKAMLGRLREDPFAFSHDPQAVRLLFSRP